MDDEELDRVLEPRKAALNCLDRALAEVEQQISSLGMAADDEQALMDAVDAIQGTIANDGLSPGTKRRIIELTDVRVVMRSADGKPVASITATLTADSTDILLGTSLSMSSSCRRFRRSARRSSARST